MSLVKNAPVDFLCGYTKIFYNLILHFTRFKTVVMLRDSYAYYFRFPKNEIEKSTIN